MHCGTLWILCACFLHCYLKIILDIWCTARWEAVWSQCGSCQSESPGITQLRNVIHCQAWAGAFCYHLVCILSWWIYYFQYTDTTVCGKRQDTGDSASLWEVLRYDIIVKGSHTCHPRIYSQMDWNEPPEAAPHLPTPERWKPSKHLLFPLPDTLIIPRSNLHFCEICNFTAPMNLNLKQ